MNPLNPFFTFRLILILSIPIFIFSACQKDFNHFNKISTKVNNNNHGHLKQTKTFTSDVALAWMNMQLRLMKTATGIPGVAV